MPLDPILATLTNTLAALQPGGLCVAFSGGMDSSVLLHALAQLPDARQRGLRALHVDHGLRAESKAWAQHSAAFAARLGIALDVVQVAVDQTPGQGLEDAARRARHAALGEMLQEGEILALAHHRDDQAETVLLKLLRGAGPEGLGGMRTMRQFGKGYLWRPLLSMPRASLATYADDNGLHWIDDPSNADTQLRRNFLRSEILPRLTQRWPDASAALAHSATWMRHAAAFIETQALQALAAVRGLDPGTIAWARWLALPDALRDPVLRLWLRDLNLDPPAHFHVTELERQLHDAAADRLPCVSWEQTQLRRYRDLLYAQCKQPPLPIEWRAVWDGSTLNLPCGGTLALRDADGNDVGGQALEVRLREGGEKLKLAGKTHTRELRLLLQEAGVPPWQRARMPLIYAGSKLIAAGDLFLSQTARELCARLRAQILWRTVDSGAPLR